MPSVLNEISQWAAGLPYWEQASLDRIVAGAELTEETYAGLLQYLLEDANLAPIISKRPVLQFDSSTLAEDEGERHGAIRLKRISNLRNINALTPNQTLEFGPQLTVIFGSNGSGKSGYARVIASAAFTRGDKQILPDVTRPAQDSEPPCAEIDIEVEGRPLQILHQLGRVCPQMHSFYVFDSTSVRAHLTRSNPMSFSPSGLEYLTRLAEVTDGVRQRLQQRVDQLNCANPFPMHFAGGDTEVSRMIDQLGAQTDESTLQQLAILSEEELARIGDLDVEIARLKSSNIPGQIAEYEQTIQDLAQLAAGLQALGQELSDSHYELLRQYARDWTQANQLAQGISIEQFRAPFFSQVGSETWHEFIQAAHSLALAESGGEATYPGEDSRCLLCRQPLEPEARQLLRRLWAFLQSDAQDRLDGASTCIEREEQQLLALRFDLLDEQAVSCRHLQEQDPGTLAKAQSYIQACRRRRDAMIEFLLKRETAGLSALPEDGIQEIYQVIGRLTACQAELEGRQVVQDIQHLGQQKLELEHRKLLAGVLDDVLLYVRNARWIDSASSPRVRRSTNHISRKYSELFDRLVTQEYIALFQDTLRQLRCPLQVQIATRAQKGATIKQIALQTDPSISPDQAAPDKVLSEGEQRAVALADFFTEVRLDKHSCGVVLDDPVSSLDFDWKEIIAHYMIAEARRQQVIVFTHDLHFLSLLEDINETAGVDKVYHWIQRRGDTPGWVFQGNSPLAESAYRKPDKAKEYLRKARQAALSSAEDEQMYLGSGFGALRTTYEVFIMHGLFRDVVLRFQERVSGDRLKTVYVDEGIRDEVTEAIGRISRHIDAHSHSDFFAAQKPTAEMLSQEIACFESLFQRHKAIRKEHGLEN